MTGSLGRVFPWLRTLEYLLFASPCVVCGEGDLPLCELCRGGLRSTTHATCPRCASQVGPWVDLKDGCSWCRSRKLGFDETIALGTYEGAVRTLCLRLKTSPNAWLSRWVVDALVDSQGVRLAGLAASRVVPVPLHWRRRFERGYNQSETLAVHLARRLGIAHDRALRRVVNTPKLAEMGRTDRKKHLRNAFRVRRNLRLDGQTILLVDDILTSGATCDSAARALKQAGAARVVTVVVGRAEGRT